MHSEEYLKVLNEEQLKAVQHHVGPLLILAGAGSGKTRVITTKIAWLIDKCGIPPEKILAVTFTNKATKEMSERAEKLSYEAGRAMIRTFHSFGVWILRRYSEFANLSSNFTIYDDDDSVSLLSQVFPQLTKNQVRTIIKKISRAKDYCLTPTDSGLQEIDSTEEFATAYKKYQTRLQETGNVDFGDLIMLPVQLLNEFTQIKNYLQNKFSVIMVDEYQDSNIAQFEFLKALVGEHTYICVVGDDDQSIYRFRGAEVQNILTFADNFSGTEIIRLEKNYRSYAEILEVADSIVKKNSGRLGKTLYAERGTGKKPELFFLPNQEAEAELCASLISEDIQNGGQYSDWAILYRMNAQSLNFESEFLHKRLPYKVIGTLKFYEREEIKDTLAVLALVANGRDEVALRRIINKPARGIGDVTQKKLIEKAREVMFLQPENGLGLKAKDDFISALSNCIDSFSITKKAKASVKDFVSMIKYLRELIQSGGGKKVNTGDGLAPFIYELLVRSGFDEYYKAEDKISGTQKVQNLNELANTASIYDFSETGLNNFLEHIELDRSLADIEEQIDSVNLITIHNTKGLEFKNVIITGLETGIFPRDNGNFDELEEERRLMYVACTRAKDSLYMTSCAMRRLYGSPSFMQPSRFLAEIDSNLIKVIGAEQNYSSFSNSELFNTEEKVVAKKNTYSIKDNPYGKQINLSNFTNTKKENPLAQKWKKGQTIYSDEYGYGGIIKTEILNDEVVITIQFETGYKKKFMPAYQSNDLTIIKN